ncbi:hypothetical protein [Streptomyces sp. 2A115]|uniref:hypothetical protein n=1 Tax=Streptomyces sp. 2A115 TaxID=3457439 RepID=UPI003FD5A204
MLWKEPEREPGAGQWTPTGIWPDERQLAMVREHLESERPLLVLLDEARSRVPMLREEWQAAPCRVVEDLTGDCPGTLVDEEVVELRLPFLDWLPATHRDRAARFLTDSDAALSRTPLALLPPLLIEERHDEVPPNPRFARRILPTALTAGRITAVVEHLFADRTQACPAGSEMGGVGR